MGGVRWTGTGVMVRYRHGCCWQVRQSNEALLPAAWGREAAGSLRSHAATIMERRGRTPRRYTALNPSEGTQMSPIVLFFGFAVPIVILTWLDRRLRREPPDGDSAR